MVGGIDRYFQVARCYRDEGTKSDRQPEFTQVCISMSISSGFILFLLQQLDIEMSFTNIDHVIKLIENLLLNCWPIDKERYEIVAPFDRICYNDAIGKYGIDKPDLRSDIEIKKLVDENVSPDNLNYYALVIPQEYVSFLSV